MKEKIAKQIVELLVRQGSELNDLLISIREDCDVEEFNRCRRATGSIMAEMLDSFLNPIFEQYPDLKPKELK